MTKPSVIFEWTGKVMQPAAGQLRIAERLYTIGETYALQPGRSALSHRHEFAWLRTAWENLPEDLAALYPTPDHLRKRALIEAGYYTETVIDAGTADAAERIAAFIRARDEFALVIVRLHFCVVREARSQSRREMPGAEFQASKQAVLEVVSAMLGIAPEQLTRNVGKAA